MVDDERSGAEFGGVGEEVRDFRVECAVQVGDRDVRLVAAGLGRETGIADGGLAG
jgi:hypothetical protein